MNKEIARKLAGTAAPLSDAELGQVAGGRIVYDPTIVVVNDPNDGGIRTNSRSGGKQDDCLD